MQLHGPFADDRSGAHEPRYSNLGFDPTAVGGALPARAAPVYVKE